VIAARAPGRVNLIGDHTDYTGGLVLPMAIDLGTAVTGERGGDRIVLTSADEPGAVDIERTNDKPHAVEPAWGRYVAGVVAQLRPVEGFRGAVSTTVPVGAGLSSSAALEVAVALALGFEGTALELAQLCQRAEQVATGVPCGIMDQLASAAGVAGYALHIDCATYEVDPVPVPDGIDVVVVHSGEARRLADSAYAERRMQCEEAMRQIGPLRDATAADVVAIDDPTVRRRARHVVTENERVAAFADALRDGRLDLLGELLLASHASLRDDFEVSTARLDAVVEELTATPGVLGARLTGAGFGGCVVAVAERGTTLDGWYVRAADGASVAVT
jgi:galactokinase